MASLLRGDLEETDMTNGNMKKIRCYFCPACANLVFTLADADIHCCGQKLALSLTCHHAATDGYHVGSFLAHLQADADAFDGFLPAL